ncbi:hypothetical protein SLE2022_333420 [Rubroshorea leprosula]
MSNDLVQQLSVPGNQMAQLQRLSNKLEPPMPIQLIGLETNEALQQQMSSTNIPIGQMEPVFNSPGSQLLSISNQQSGQIPPQTYHLVSQQYLVPNNPIGDRSTILHSVQPQQSSILSKRKMPIESMSNGPDLQKLLMPNKRVAQMEQRPWLQPISAANNRVVQMQAMSNNPGSHSSELSKKPVPSKSGSSALKVKPVPMQASPKAQSESSESVRSKMRESLAAALALVFQSQGESSSVGKISQCEVTSSPGKTEKDSHAADYTSVNVASESAELQVRLLSNEDGGAHVNVSDATQNVKCDGQQFQSDNLLSEEDVSFSENVFVRDELLQGNGLSWVLEPEIEILEKKEVQTFEKKNSDAKVGANNSHQPLRTPKILAFKIEAELFKLFGGVNKKYKEKGRSLLFNLKDRNNPELRERVMSGDIVPERLCSMTAEELASKELSQWRQAKAEELAQMVVLTDTDVDIRRLVKKTHKGEFQVEVEQADSTSVEVSAGATTLTRRPKTEAKKPAAANLIRRKDEGNAVDGKSNLEDHNVSSTITIPSTEGTDPMQGLMVEDELKDTEFLPPIVSLDEFMQSLDSEPPFETLPGDGVKSTPISDKGDTDVRSELKSVGQSPQEDTIDGSPDKPDTIVERRTKYDSDTKSGGVPVRIEDVDSVTLNCEQIWEGSLQLNVMAVTSVVGIFKSGEKTSIKEWPSLLEIKGRVKLDAFEKFLQELPMSRSRAVMVVHFVCKEASPKSLGEVAVSYVSEGRVGFAEPAPGMELYFCPPRSKTLEMFAKILSKDQLHALNAIDNGLIGVVVWRRAQLISPSHPKHISRKQHFISSSRRQQEKDTNLNSSNLVSKPASSTYSKPPPDDDDDDDDDVPPGFGPGTVSRDEDDLPEFNFTSGTNPSGPQPYSTRFSSQGPGLVPSHLHPRTPSRPVDQIRELIHKYGQPSSGIISTWNDDDDDIPEWLPQMHKPQQRVAPSPTSLNSFQQQIHRPQEIHQQVFPAVYIQSQPNAAHQAPAWGAPQDPRGEPVNGDQFYGTPSWPKDAPKSRGF